jgi:hypothetical protein
MLRNSRVAAQVVASEEGFSSMESAAFVTRPNVSDDSVLRQARAFFAALTLFLSSTNLKRQQVSRRGVDHRTTDRTTRVVSRNKHAASARRTAAGVVYKLKSLRLSGFSPLEQCPDASLNVAEGTWRGCSGRKRRDEMGEVAWLQGAAAAGDEQVRIPAQLHASSSGLTFYSK